MGGLNTALFNFIHDFAGRSGFWDKAGFFFADTLLYLLMLGGIWYVLRLPGMRRKIFMIAEICLAVLLSRGIITTIIRFAYHHARPFVALNFTPLISGENPYDSFPSGHMTGLFAFSAILYAHNRKWGIAYFILSALVGLSRVYTGVHWPLDILGGILIGLACAWIVHALAKPYWEKLQLQDSA